MTSWWYCWMGHEVDYSEPRYAIELEIPKTTTARIQVCKKHLQLAAETMLKEAKK